ncbi:MAG: outer membrane protein transport protein [Chromatiaceae bacterium]|jgi:long-chain fatty acid transport protein|nr:outer membrane protein transport protein [Chromatiaceae bacterium]
MFEHVGPRNYPRFFEVLDRCLAPDGLALLHTIGRHDTTALTDPWIDRHIFPGGKLPSARQIAAAAGGPAAVGFNPAAVPERRAASASLHRIAVDLRPHDAGATHAVPALYASAGGIGLGLYAPFGLTTRYPPDWPGRYQAIHSETQSLRAHLTGAVKLTPELRLGAGVFAQRFRAELSQAVPTPAGDAELRIDGEDTGLGGSAGLLWTPRAGLAFGLAYTSPVRYRLRGRARLPLRSTGARVDLTTPESVAAGLRWQTSPALTLLAGATWTRWSRLQSVDVALADGRTLSEPHGWRGAWRLDLGAEHSRGPLTWRAGLAWDQSPVPDAARRAYPTTTGSGWRWAPTGAAAPGRSASPTPTSTLPTARASVRRSTTAARPTFSRSGWRGHGEHPPAAGRVAAGPGQRAGRLPRP